MQNTITKNTNEQDIFGKDDLSHGIIKGDIRACMKGSFVLQWYDSTSELLKAIGLKI